MKSPIPPPQVNINGNVIDPDFSTVVQNLTSGILMIRGDINPDANNYVSLYGTSYEKNNRAAIEQWVFNELMKRRHTLSTIVIAFCFHHFDIQQEINKFIN